MSAVVRGVLTSCEQLCCCERGLLTKVTGRSRRHHSLLVWMELWEVADDRLLSIRGQKKLNGGVTHKSYNTHSRTPNKQQRLFILHSVVILRLCELGLF